MTGDGMAILQDAATRPQLFDWIGAPGAEALDSWLVEHALNVPDDLLAFWRVTGGGVAFESEELLRPIGAADPSESLWARNDWHRSQGMPVGFLLFHEGAWLSAARAIAPRYVTLSRGYAVKEEYSSFAEWYRCTLRGEFAERYGLATKEP